MVKTGVCYYFGNFEYVSAKVWTSEHIVTDSLIQLNRIKWWVLLEDVLDVFFLFLQSDPSFFDKLKYFLFNQSNTEAEKNFVVASKWSLKMIYL